MKPIVSRSLLATALIPVALLTAPPASAAAPDDVTATVAVSGHTVYVTIDNRLPITLGCSAYPRHGTGSYSGFDYVEPGGTKTFRLYEYAEVQGGVKVVGTRLADGAYDIQWRCQDARDIGLPSGTPPASGEWGTIPVAEYPAQPIAVSVPAAGPDGPDLPGTGATGSLDNLFGS
ncbi:hypothetical protein FCG67_14635 [Rhodococcus oryzae]|uniref:Secreted protein n=1 Tax=Rhodococcus oryzae TaxID=2571143 RepID=A0ABY2RIM7_9NOCA|nr:hypothetical protein [Rhodococcus oryzae]TJZ77080.1 hypothetical protein FCG67_14635 [Rhodococcus oryzae]